jgi:hypothetical protein
LATFADAACLEYQTKESKEIATERHTQARASLLPPLHVGKDLQSFKNKNKNNKLGTNNS